MNYRIGFEIWPDLPDLEKTEILDTCTTIVTGGICVFRFRMYD